MITLHGTVVSDFMLSSPNRFPAADLRFKEFCSRVGIGECMCMCMCMCDSNHEQLSRYTKGYGMRTVDNFYIRYLDRNIMQSERNRIFHLVKQVLPFASVMEVGS